MKLPEIVDLTHPYHKDIPVPGFFPTPLFRYFMDVTKDPLNVTEFHLSTHIGTHVDAPLHLFAGGKAIDEIPVASFIGTGMVIETRKEAGELITVDDLGEAGTKVMEGDIVILYTGWCKKYLTGEYPNHPYLSMEVADWLVEKKIKLMGIDTVTPDMPVPLRPKGFNWPIHRRLLGSGVLVAENLANLDAIAGKRVTIIAAPVVIKGADGGPARVLAITGN
jgi:kynurenine formamidase